MFIRHQPSSRGLVFCNSGISKAALKTYYQEILHFCHDVDLFVFFVFSMLGKESFNNHAKILDENKSYIINQPHLQHCCY